MLIVAGFVLAGDTPNQHALGPEIGDAYDNETQHQIATFLVAVAAVPLLFCACYFRAVLNRRHPRGESQRASHWRER